MLPCAAPAVLVLGLGATGAGAAPVSFVVHQATRACVERAAIGRRALLDRYGSGRLDLFANRPLTPPPRPGDTGGRCRRRTWSSPAALFWIRYIPHIPLGSRVFDYVGDALSGMPRTLRKSVGERLAIGSDGLFLILGEGLLGSASRLAAVGARHAARQAAYASAIVGTVSRPNPS